MQPGSQRHTLWAYRAMARRAECLLHALLGTGQHVAARSHGAANQDRLARELIVHGDEWVVWRECAGGALAVHQQLAGPAVEPLNERPAPPAHGLDTRVYDQHVCASRTSTKLQCARHRRSTHMLFDFGDVVGDVVDDLHVQVVRALVERLGKGLAGARAGEPAVTLSAIDVTVAHTRRHARLRTWRHKNVMLERFTHAKLAAAAIAFR